MYKNLKMNEFLDESTNPILIKHFNNKKECKSWLSNNHPDQEPFYQDQSCFLITELKMAILVFDEMDPWGICEPIQNLPRHREYSLDENIKSVDNHCIAWALSFYAFDKYLKKPKYPEKPKLVWPKQANKKYVESMIKAIENVRNLINEPANILTPDKLCEETKSLYKEFNVVIKKISKDDELKKDYPLVHAVGRASENPPCVIKVKYKPKNAKKHISLVGKGVCFDSGGLDLKPSSNMLNMKKDMGGAAHIISLGYLIMSMGLPISFDMYIPAVENSVGPNAFRPKDILTSRKGTTVEIGNTDAEGRLILADVLYEASQYDNDLIIDFATLTGSARVAMGLEIPAFFTNNRLIEDKLRKCCEKKNDPAWPLPLAKNYKKYLKSNCADLSSTGSTPYGGAITAALFLEHFVGETPWIHIDLMAYNTGSKPGRPEGGEAMSLRGVFQYLTTFEKS